MLAALIEYLDDLRFQDGELLGDRGRGQVQGLGGRGDGAVGREVLEDPEPAHIEPPAAETEEAPPAVPKPPLP